MRVVAFGSNPGFMVAFPSPLLECTAFKIGSNGFQIGSQQLQSSAITLHCFTLQSTSQFKLKLSLTRFCSLTESFQILDRVLLFLSSFPAGTYLLQTTLDALSQLRLHRASSDATDLKSLDSFLALLSIQAEIDLVPPEWTPQSDRFPYSFRKFSYCPSYLTAGVCITEVCESVHLRLSHEKGVVFDDSKVLQSVRSRGRRINTSQIQFCREIEWNVHRLHARVTCSAACALPHLTLHQVLERLADQNVREEREKTRQKKRRRDKSTFPSIVETHSILLEHENCHH